MNVIPTVAFAAYSGTGKTTLIEKLVVIMKEQGLRVAVIKHDAHNFEIDHEGKDSWRFANAGADITIISSSKKTAFVEQRERTLWETISMVRDVDIILLEGYKHEMIPKIGLCRKVTGKGLPLDVDNYIAVATDDEDLVVSCQRFDLDDIQGLSRFIIENMDSFRTIIGG